MPFGLCVPLRPLRFIRPGQSWQLVSHYPVLCVLCGFPRLSPVVACPNAVREKQAVVVTFPPSVIAHGGGRGLFHYRTSLYLCVLCGSSHRDKPATD